MTWAQHSAAISSGLQSTAASTPPLEQVSDYFVEMLLTANRDSAD